MTRNTKIFLLGTGVAVAVGTLAYFVCKTVSSRKKVTENAKQETDTHTDEVPAHVALSAKEFVEHRKEALKKRNEENSDSEATTDLIKPKDGTEFASDQV